MVNSIAAVLGQIKRDWQQQFSDEVVLGLCREAELKWRERVLTPLVTVRLFLLQILRGNLPCNQMPHAAQMSFTGQAYCAARARLPRTILEGLLRITVETLGKSALDASRWLGHRVFLVDGSTFSMSDTPELQEQFGQPGNQAPGCGFPVAHWLAMMHYGTGMVVRMLTAPLRTHDQSRVAELHPELQAGDVLVGDRGFCSYVHLALLFLRQAHGVFRVHQRTIVSFRRYRKHVPRRRGKHGNQKGQPRSEYLQSLGTCDQLVKWFKPVESPAWLDQGQFQSLPETLVVRETRCRIRRRGFRVAEVTLVTTLLDATRYSVEDLATLYLHRWSVETNFRHLKTTMGLEVLRCQTVEGVLKELTVFAIAYNLVRLVMFEAAQRQRVPVTRISFVDALRWLAHATPTTPLRNLVVNPFRPGRVDPRAVKRRPKEYDRLNRPRASYEKSLARQPLTS
jgi:hypothetical protein